MQSAAWRVSLWSSLAFALGTALVFAMLHRFVAEDIQRRTDAWLSGEVEVLSDVAERTPKDRLYQKVVGEVAELASREVPDKQQTKGSENDAVFFLQASEAGPPKLWVGTGDGIATLAAIRSVRVLQDVPFDVNIQGVNVPFRVASVRIDDGTSIYLGLSERDELHVLRKLRIRFLVLCAVTILLGFLIVFYATRKMLGRVSQITEAASLIGQSDLSSRVPDTKGNDEIAQLARTLNYMLDRIQNTVQQLHAITDSLSHDIRSPLTAIRSKLETSLSSDSKNEHTESIVTAIEDLDRLTEFLNTSLDVAEAQADALRLSRTELDLDQLVRTMIDLYEPSMADRGLAIHVRSAGPIKVMVDQALFHRVIANLLDNELKHLPSSSTVELSLSREDGMAILVIEDDGPGFDPEITNHLCERRIKGRESHGHGLGLAFVAAVTRAHGGTLHAENRRAGGTRLTISLPSSETSKQGDTVHLVSTA
ncbi:ATP-binding protein [Terriglobus roseus]|uniref:histidine kinase n=1 Tax=Terriglobus roseus TaxID=392734 RepID=A0A1G7NMK6_9BACT|nr:ATP-binding protein [Terriglobus roseus]SDF75171.1 Signal transduction histidine kinase [Terriglobus roseus]